jgi:hypothetical protein
MHLGVLLIVSMVIEIVAVLLCVWRLVCVAGMRRPFMSFLSL